MTDVSNKSEQSDRRTFIKGAVVGGLAIASGLPFSREKGPGPKGL